jgi:hypothetical protein
MSESRTGSAADRALVGVSRHARFRSASAVVEKSGRLYGFRRDATRHLAGITQPAVGGDVVNRTIAELLAYWDSIGHH